MKFKRLVEAPGDDKPISPVSRRPSEYTVDNLPDETKDLIEKGQWTQAYRTLTNTREIEVFINYFIDNCDLLVNFKDKLKPIRDVLVRTMMSLGDRAFQEETNPLLRFLNSYLGVGDKKFDSADQFRNLVNWWSEGIITDKNLRETSVDKSILLNDNLYDMQNSTFIVQAYYWLSKKNNVKAYINLDKESVRNAVQETEDRINYIVGPQGRLPAGWGLTHNDGKHGGEFDYKKINYEDFRNMIIFVNPDDRKGAINPAEEIQARLTRMQAKADELGDIKDDSSEGTNISLENEDEAGDDWNTRTSGNMIPFKRLRWDSREIARILSKGIGNLSSEDANKLVTYFRDNKLI